MDNELILFDRLNIIKDTINKYGADNFYLSFSGGKDSTVLHHLLDMALPGNTIPRVFINTGIEYIDIVKFVRSMAEKDNRFEIINTGVNIKQMLRSYGYPFKSKAHCKAWVDYQNGRIFGIKYYKHEYKHTETQCPKVLLYQFEQPMPFKLSPKCCDLMKKAPIHKFEKESKKHIRITGIRPSEGGQRVKAVCQAMKDNKLYAFQPLVKVDDEWEQWFIGKYNIQLCKLYYEPYNFERTGCKGCPFALNLQEQLETMEKYLPNERKQCEILWQPVYAEYRRIGYRLKKEEQLKLL